MEGHHLEELEDVDILASEHEHEVHVDPAKLNSGLVTFHVWFQGFHGYASIVVCAFGICTNFFNITILMRKDMRTPTNFLLMWLAVSDILTMVPYIPFVANFYCPPALPYDAPERYTYSWAMYMLLMINFVATTHTISIWIGVSLAAFRFIQMKSTSRGPLAKERRMKQVKVITVAVYIISSLVLIPNYMTNKLEALPMGNNITVYAIKDLKLATNETEDIVLANVITYAVVAKLIPCFLILIFSGSLVYHLSVKGKSRRRRLAISSCSKSSKHARQATTTRMLLVVIILFIITELPQGVLILLSAKVPGFYDNVYNLLGDLMDFIALLNNAINFVLYCIMSQQFRTRFVQMYLRRRGLPLKSISESMTSEKMSLREPPTRTTGAE